ncbi:hypothetical protein [Paratractidigestivibacter sp.]|uniref:hypothetical protein n=1 Tax=Paratractidigestivibacter sp. TaxID=2847316 RepID=UPI002ABD34FF|nr:hypothetical protein [Paratractidigestivibacter sp.]
MKLILTLRMEDGSKQEIEQTGKTLTEIFSGALGIEGAKEIIKSERVGEIGEYVNVKQDEQELHQCSDDRHWVKLKVPNAPFGEEHHDPNDWYVEVDGDGKRLPGYWIYIPIDGDYGVAECVVG